MTISRDTFLDAVRNNKLQTVINGLCENEKFANTESDFSSQMDSILAWALFWKHTDIAKYLILFGADLSYKNKQNQLASIWAKADMYDYIERFKNQEATAYLILAYELSHNTAPKVQEKIQALKEKYWPLIKDTSNQDISKILASIKSIDKNDVKYIAQDVIKAQHIPTIAALITYYFSTKEFNKSRQLLNEAMKSIHSPELCNQIIDKVDLTKLIREEIADLKSQNKNINTIIRSHIQLMRDNNENNGYNHPVLRQHTLQIYIELLNDNVEKELLIYIANYFACDSNKIQLEAVKKLYEKATSKEEKQTTPLPLEYDRILIKLASIYKNEKNYQAAKECSTKSKLKIDPSIEIAELTLKEFKDENKIAASYEEIGEQKYYVFEELSYQQSQILWKKLNKEQQIDLVNNGLSGPNTYHAILKNMPTSAKLTYCHRLAKKQDLNLSTYLSLINESNQLNSNEQTKLAELLIEASEMIIETLTVNKDSDSLNKLLSFIGQHQNDNTPGILKKITPQLFDIYLEKKQLSQCMQLASKSKERLSTEQFKKLALTCIQSSSNDMLQKAWELLDTEAQIALLQTNKKPLITSLNQDQLIALIKNLNDYDNEIDVLIFNSNNNSNIKCAFLEKFVSSLFMASRLAEYYSQNNQYAKSIETLQSLAKTKKLYPIDQKTLLRLADAKLQDDQAEVVNRLLFNYQENNLSPVDEACARYNLLSQKPDGYEDIVIASGNIRDEKFYQAITSLSSQSLAEDKEHPNRHHIKTKLRNPLFSKLADENTSDTKLAQQLFQFYAEEKNIALLGKAKKQFILFKESADEMLRKKYARICFAIAKESKNDADYLEAEKYDNTMTDLATPLARIYATDGNHNNLDKAIDYIKKSIGESKLTDEHQDVLKTIKQSKNHDDKSSVKFYRFIIFELLAKNKITKSLFQAADLLRFLSNVSPDWLSTRSETARLATIDSSKNPLLQEMWSLAANSNTMTPTTRAIAILASGIKYDSDKNRNLIIGLGHFFGIKPFTVNKRQAVNHFKESAEMKSPDGCFWHALTQLELRKDPEAIKIAISRFNQAIQYSNQPIMIITTALQLVKLFGSYSLSNDDQEAICTLIDNISNIDIKISRIMHTRHLMNEIEELCKKLKTKRLEDAKARFHVQFKDPESAIKLYELASSTQLKEEKISEQQKADRAKAYYALYKIKLNDRELNKAVQYGHKEAKLILADSHINKGSVTDALKLYQEMVSTADDSQDNLDFLAKLKDKIKEIKSLCSDKEVEALNKLEQIIDDLTQSNKLENSFLQWVDDSDTEMTPLSLYSKHSSYIDKLSSSLPQIREKHTQYLECIANQLGYFEITSSCKPYIKSGKARIRRLLSQAIDESQELVTRVNSLKELSTIQYFNGRGIIGINRALWFAWSAAFLKNAKIEDYLHPLALKNTDLLKRLEEYKIVVSPQSCSLRTAWNLLYKNGSAYQDKANNFKKAVDRLIKDKSLTLNELNKNVVLESNKTKSSIITTTNIFNKDNSINQETKNTPVLFYGDPVNHETVKQEDLTSFVKSSFKDLKQLYANALKSKSNEDIEKVITACSVILDKIKYSKQLYVDLEQLQCLKESKINLLELCKETKNSATQLRLRFIAQYARFIVASQELHLAFGKKMDYRLGILTDKCDPYYQILINSLGDIDYYVNNFIIQYKNICYADNHIKTLHSLYHKETITDIYQRGYYLLGLLAANDILSSPPWEQLQKDKSNLVTIATTESSQSTLLDVMKKLSETYFYLYTISRNGINRSLFWAFSRWLASNCHGTFQDHLPQLLHDVINQSSLSHRALKKYKNYLTMIDTHQSQFANKDYREIWKLLKNESCITDALKDECINLDSLVIPPRPSIDSVSSLISSTIIERPVPSAPVMNDVILSTEQNTQLTSTTSLYPILNRATATPSPPPIFTSSNEQINSMLGSSTDQVIVEQSQSSTQSSISTSSHSTAEMKSDSIEALVIQVQSLPLPNAIQNQPISTEIQTEQQTNVEPDKNTKKQAVLC